MDTLRVLVVGSSAHLDRIKLALAGAGHNVVSVAESGEASEALLNQRFDAVLVGSGIPAAVITQLTETVRKLDRQSASGTRTPLLAVVPEPLAEQSALTTVPTAAGVDAVVSEDVDPESLTIAIARLATAVGSNEGFDVQGSGLPVLDVEQLKEQVAHDDDLLVELIDLFLTERLRQSAEMREALAAGQLDRLSRVAHTIKGSLGSLHGMIAKADAQALELAARQNDVPNSEHFLTALDRDLDALEEELIALRQSVKPF